MGAAESAATLSRLSDADFDVEATSKNPRMGQKSAGFIVDHPILDRARREAHRPDTAQRDAVSAEGSIRERIPFLPPSPAAAPIRGRAERFPIRRIFCVGRNYEAHAKEMGVAVDCEAPFYFTKASEHYAPSGATIAYPPGTTNYHYEMELARRPSARRDFASPKERALEHVFGYACGLDMTRRDLQSAAKEKAAALGHRQGRRAVGGARRHRAGSGGRPPRPRPHRATGQRSDEAVGRTRRSRFTASLAVIAHLSQYRPSAAGLFHLHRDAGRRGRGEAGRSAEVSIEGVVPIAVTVGDPA